MFTKQSSSDILSCKSIDAFLSLQHANNNSNRRISKIQ